MNLPSCSLLKPRVQPRAQLLCPSQTNSWPRMHSSCAHDSAHLRPREGQAVERGLAASTGLPVERLARLYVTMHASNQDSSERFV